MLVEVAATKKSEGGSSWFKTLFPMFAASIFCYILLKKYLFVKKLYVILTLVLTPAERCHIIKCPFSYLFMNNSSDE